LTLTARKQRCTALLDDVRPDGEMPLLCLPPQGLAAKLVSLGRNLIPSTLEDS